MSQVSAVVVAAGRGFRFNSHIPKPLAKIDSKPILIYALEKLSRHRLIKDIVVVVNPQNEKGIISQIKKYKIRKVTSIVRGGRRRQDSVLNGIKMVDKKTDFILVHDAVRPFFEEEKIASLIRQAQISGAAILGVPVKATIKKLKIQNSKFKIVEKTIDRDNLWEIQTPQVFKKKIILEAYKRFPGSPVTDDASLTEKLGIKVRTVLGSYLNIKITTLEDLLLAKAINRCLFA